MEDRGAYYIDQTAYHEGVQQVGYNTFMRQLQDTTVTAPGNVSRSSSKSVKSSSKAPGSSKGSLRFQLVKARAKLTFEREQLLQQHELQKRQAEIEKHKAEIQQQQAEIQHQLLLLQNNRTLAELELESEYPDDDLDFLEKLTNVPSPPRTPEHRTEEWAERHFDISMSQQQYTNARLQPRIPPEITRTTPPLPLPGKAPFIKTELVTPTNPTRPCPTNFDHQSVQPTNIPLGHPGSYGQYCMDNQDHQFHTGFNLPPTSAASQLPPQVDTRLKSMDPYIHAPAPQPPWMSDLTFNMAAIPWSLLPRT